MAETTIIEEFDSEGNLVKRTTTTKDDVYRQPNGQKFPPGIFPGYPPNTGPFWVTNLREGTVSVSDGHATMTDCVLG